MQPLFISCAAAQGLLFVLSLISERYLRHAGRLLPNHRRREKALAALSIVFGTIGQLGILFVSIFNTRDYSDVHVAMLVVFIVGVGISALLFTAELALLDRAYKEQSRLRISAVLKVVWFLIALGLVIGFAVCSRNEQEEASAGCEWSICFFYGFYLLILAYDLAPAAKTRKGQLLEQKVSYGLTRAVSWIPGMNEERDEALINQNAMRELSPIGETVYKHRELHNGAGVATDPEAAVETVAPPAPAAAGANRHSYRGQDFDVPYGASQPVVSHTRDSSGVPLVPGRQYV